LRKHFSFIPNNASQKAENYCSKTGVANLLPAGIFLPLSPFLNALKNFLELLNKFFNRKLNPNYVLPLLSLSLSVMLMLFDKILSLRNFSFWGENAL
jgi:hypothetical protein